MCSINWALQQVDAAYTASQQAPVIAADLRTFNEPLPQLIDQARAEREARQKAKGTEKDATESQAARKLDFSDTSDPIHFTRTVAMQAAAWRLTACASPDDENPLLRMLLVVFLKLGHRLKSQRGLAAPLLAEH